MASILSRFTSIVKANINELIDRAEDPEKMVDQYLREMAEDLAEVKEATAGVMAEEKRCQRALRENEDKASHYEDLAKTALREGNEDDARTLLAKKELLTGEHEGLKAAYDAAHDNALKMRQMHDKLVDDIQQLNARKETIKAKAAVAKTQDRVTELTSGVGKTHGSEARAAFDRMEAKADAMLDRSNAKVELNSEDEDSAEALEKKYSKAGRDARIDDELERLKAEISKED